MVYGNNYDGTLMSWVSFVLEALNDQKPYFWHVTSETGLARATVVTNDEL